MYIYIYMANFFFEYIILLKFAQASGILKKLRIQFTFSVKDKMTFTKIRFWRDLDLQKVGFGKNCRFVSCIWGKNCAYKSNVLKIANAENESSIFPDLHET